MPPTRWNPLRSRMGILLVLAGLFHVHVSPAQSSSRRPPFADAPLARNLRGAEALQSLGGRLKEVAEFHRMPEAELRGLLQRDHSLWLDRHGRLFYVCEFELPPQQGPVGESTNNPPVNPLYLANQTFKLHSRPGASRVIYLDFDGHDASTTVWGSSSGNAPISRAYDTDGSPYTFGNPERQSIQYIWGRVAEDFLQYDIDVTTEDPGVAALQNLGTGRYGVRVVIGGDWSDWFGSSAGGVAYLNSFDDAEDVPCLVFPKSLSDNEKNIAEACSHEAGHTLGLIHDGQTTGVDYYAGHGNWAPIMGVGYNRPIVHWSKGEYTAANNTEDDLTKMLSFGAINRPDDYGNSIGAASPLTGVRPFRWGIIGSSTDVDFFAFQAGAGRTTITCTPAPRGPNLHILLSLYDDNGALILSADVPDNATTGVLPVTIAPILATGTYFVSVDGIGALNPVNTGYSDYGSLGQYTLLVTLPGDGTWFPASGGNYSWTNEANWASGTIPLGASATARINNDIVGDQVVETDMPLTIGGLTLGDADDSHHFTVSASGPGLLLFAVTNGSAWINKATGLDDSITAPLQLLNNLVVTNATAHDLVLAGPTSGPFTLTKVGSGRLVLAGTNSGGTGLVVAGGSLLLSDTASIASVAAVAVQTGAVLDVSPQPGGWLLDPVQTLSGSGVITGNVTTASSSRLSPGAPGLPGTLTFASRLTFAAGSALDLNLGATTNAGGGSNDLVAVAGDLVLNGLVTVSFDFAGAPPETNDAYTLLTYAGTLTGGATNFVAASAGNRFSYTFDDSVPGEIRMHVSGVPVPLVWQGGAISNRWDVGNATNWLNAGSPDAFFQGDAVLFDSSGSTIPAVSLAGVLSPASVIVSNTSGYTFSGSGRISGGAAITKQGSGSLTLATSNDFGGVTFVQEGTVVLGNAAALGLTNAGTTVSGMGRLDLNGIAVGNERLTVSGSGPAGDGALINTGSMQSNAVRLVTLAGDTTLGGSARWDIRGVPASNLTASLTGNGFALTKTGANQIWFANLGSMLLGNITVNQGTLGFEGTNTMANTSAPLTVNAGATLAFLNAFDSDFAKVLSLDSCTLRNDSGHNNLTGASTTLSGVVTASVGEGAVLDLRGFVGGAGGFDKTGKGILRLAGANSFSGNVTINAGTVMVGNTAALGSIAGATTVAAGARLDVAAFNLGAEQIFVAGSGINARGAIVNSLPNSQINALRFVTLNGDATFGGNGRWDLRANPTGSLQGAFNLTKVGQNEIWLVNLDATQLKAITINRGTLGFQGTTTMGDPTTTMTVNAGGTLGISGTGANVLGKVLSLNSGRISNIGGSNTLVGNVSLTSSNQIDVGSGAVLVLGGTVSGSGNFGKTSAGTLILGGTVATAGASYVNAGTLQIGAGGSSGNLASTLNNNASLVFNRTVDATHSATINGNGTITKLNTNTLTLSAANNFTGAITVGAGTLRVENASALGTGSGGTIVASGATLDVNGFNLGAEVVTASGAGTGGGAVINTGASQNNALQFLTLAGDTTLGGSARWDLRSVGGAGSLSTGGQPWSLAKTGLNFISLAGVTIDAALGDVSVREGVLALESLPSFGNPAASVILSGEGTLQLDLTNAFDKAVVFTNGGTLAYVGASPGIINGPISLLSDLASVAMVQNASVASLQINGALSGPGGIVLLGGLIQLNGVNSHEGTTVISTGTLALGAGATLGASFYVLVNGVFDVSALAGGLILNPPQTLAGNGTVLGNVTANGIVSPGTSVGTLTISGNATLAGITRVEVNKSGSTLTNDLLAVTSTLAFGGMLEVTNTGSPLTVSNSFKLFNAGTMTGTFSSFSLPPLNPGLTWSLATLHTDGWLRVVSNTPPAVSGVAINGSGMVVSGTGGAPGALYHVVTSTNVTLPLASWPALATNMFDTSGHFIFTNTISPTPGGQFLRLRVP